MLAVPTCTVSILRGTTTNGFGDTVDDNTSVAVSGVRASILSGPRSNQRPVDGTPRVIRSKTLRVPAGTDLRVDDRIKNEVTGDLYTVDEIYQPENIVTTQDIQARLRRVT